MDPNALSIVALKLRSHLSTRLNLDVRQILIGHPNAAFLEQKDQAITGGLLNLFFYRIEHGGYPADGANTDPFYIRIFCLITPFSLKDSSGLSAGEKDLRMIGVVMAALHVEPYIHLTNDNNEEVGVLQVLLSPFSIDDINHLWATQGDIPYRLSVPYEFALLPVPFASPIKRSPRVGTLGLDVSSFDVSSSVQQLPFNVPSVRVETSDPAWAPAIRFVDAKGRFLYALTYASSEMPEQVEIIGAGLPGVSVELVWDYWDKSNGWKSILLNSATLELTTDTLGSECDGCIPTQVNVPDKRKGQLQLTAQRVWEKADGTKVLLRSNPLLISIHDEVIS